MLYSYISMWCRMSVVYVTALPWKINIRNAHSFVRSFIHWVRQVSGWMMFMQRKINENHFPFEQVYDALYYSVEENEIHGANGGVIKTRCHSSYSIIFKINKLFCPMRGVHRSNSDKKYSLSQLSVILGRETTCE